MIQLYREIIESEQPLIWNILGLRRKRFLIFKLVWSDYIEQIPNLEKMLTEVFALIPDIPVIFPFPEETPIFFIDQINAPNLYLAGSLERSEIYYLQHHSLGIITAQPCINDGIAMMDVCCLTNPAF